MEPELSFFSRSETVLRLIEQSVISIIISSNNDYWLLGFDNLFSFITWKGKREKTMKEIIYRPIGIIHSPFKDIKGMPIQPTVALDIAGTEEIEHLMWMASKILKDFSMSK
jgi:hypothetical protein